MKKLINKIQAKYLAFGAFVGATFISNAAFAVAADSAAGKAKSIMDIFITTDNVEVIKLILTGAGLAAITWGGSKALMHGKFSENKPMIIGGTIALILGLAFVPFLGIIGITPAASA